MTIGRWLTAVDDERGTLKIEFYRGLAFLHLTFRLPLEGVRSVRKLFPQLKAWLKSMGHFQVLAIIPDGDAKRCRFLQAFGFKEAGRINGRIIMWQDC